MFIKYPHINFIESFTYESEVDGQPNKNELGARPVERIQNKQI